MDPREMIGLPPAGVAAAAAQQAAPAAASSSSRSHHGSSGVQQALPRELALLKSELRWDASDPVAPAMPIPSREGMMKAKRVKAVSWRLLPIRSSARTARTGGVVDDLDLFSWCKIHNVADYRFARFNKRVRMLDYTDDEYTQYLSDPTWSRAETDRLMELAKQYDLRFIIMEDRYNQPAAEAELARVQAKLDTVEHVRPLGTLLHQQAPAEEAKEQAQAHAANSVALAPNLTMSTHPTPAVEAEAKSSAMDTTDSAAASAAAANVATPAGATVPAASTAAGTEVAAAAASPSSSPAAPQPSPAVPVSMLMPPARTAPSSSRDLVFPYRSVEQLKARFYFIQQTLTAVRNASDPELRKTNPLFTHPYDAAHELVRKAQLERLYQRTAVETDAMAEMVLEHRRVLAAIKKIKKTQKDERDAARGITKSATKRDRSGPAGADRSKQRAGGPAAPAAGVLKRPIAPVVGELAPIPQTCDASSVLPVRPPGVYLRSSQLLAPLNLSSRQQKFLESELNNLNVRRARDATVATGVVCDMWDRLRVNVLTLANLQQYVREREVMRDDLRAHSSSAPQMAAAAAAAAGGAPGVSVAQQYQAAQAQAAAAAMRKKAEKRKLEGADAESEADKRARKGK